MNNQHMTGSEALTYFAFSGPSNPRQADRPTTPAQPLPDVLSGRYRIERLLGVGGMGAVYRGCDLLRKELGDPHPYVALKTLSESFLDYADAHALLHSEFALTSRLHHSHVIRLFGFEIDPVSERAFIIMELLTGCTLDDLLLRYPQGLPWLKARDISQALLLALRYIHSQGVIHGDIKPSNLMLGSQGIRLFDFGLGHAKANSLAGLPQLSRERFTAWTPRYAAPEVLDGSPLSTATDLYSAACVIYELCHGQPPYPQANAQHAEARCAEPTKPSDMPQRVWQVLKQSLAFEPGKRPRSVDALLSAVEAQSKLAALTSWLNRSGRN